MGVLKRTNFSRLAADCTSFETLTGRILKPNLKTCGPANITTAQQVDVTVVEILDFRTAEQLAGDK